MLIPSFQSGEVVENGKLKSKLYNTLDTDKLIFCWRHSLTLTSDWKNPNKKDKDKLDEIRLQNEWIKDKKGMEHKFRFCPKCYQQVLWTKIPK